MGYRQVALALRNEQGLRISGKTVLRLMREEGLRCRIRRRRYGSYRGDQGKAARNVLDRDFSSDAPMRKLVTDITEFHQPWGKAYLSPVMDLYNNEIVAWSVSERPNMAQINEMVAMLELRLDGPALLHSDSKNVISRFCGNRNGAVSCKPGPRRSILTRTPIDWSASVA